MKRWLLVVAVAVVAAVAGFGVAQWQRSASDPWVGQPQPGFELGATDGRVVRAADFAGDVLLVNFWATWCVPCREEMPMLQALADEYAGAGFRVVGIALDDVQRVRDFVAEMGIGYPVLVGAGDVVATSRAWGNDGGMLPYSVLVGRDGRIAWRHLGEVSERQLRERLAQHL